MILKSGSISSDRSWNSLTKCCDLFGVKGDFERNRDPSSSGDWIVKQ